MIDGRQLAQYEVYQHILHVPGFILELGVGPGRSFLTWMGIAHALEPTNYARRFLGFDTFKGFPTVGPQDGTAQVGDQNHGIPKGWFLDGLDYYARLLTNAAPYGPRFELIAGDLQNTIPDYLAEHPEVVVALLLLDVDLYAPTKFALETLWPRIPRGGVVVFDEFAAAAWAGETMALLETVGVGTMALRKPVTCAQWAYLVKP